jgi:hypothetical protein
MDAGRRAQIVRLLETRDDHLPVLSAKPLSSLGFVHRALFRESCPDCLANDGRRPGCETCGGRGYLEGRRSRDPYDTGMSSGWFGSSSERHEAGREREREIARLEAQTAPPRSEADIAAEIPPDPWERARDDRWARFDYGALDLALDELRLVDGSACRELHAEFVYGVRRGSVSATERGLEFLSSRLPDPLRAPAAVTPLGPVLAIDGKARDREIRRLVRDGAASGWVARRFGLSVSQVNRIVAGGRVEAEA